MTKTIPIQGNLKVLGSISLNNILINSDGVYVNDVLIGQKGDQGVKGDTGTPGLDSTVPGPKGDTGLQGVKGDQGIQGIQGIQGVIGPAGADSVVPGPQGEQGIQGIQGLTGASGSGSSTVFNNTSRYFVNSTPGETVQCVSTSTVFAGLTWSRVGAVLTINHVGHGRSVGNRVIIRNTNVDSLITLITSVTVDSYDVVCADTGSLGNTTGAYSNGFTFAHNTAQPSIASGILSAPANCDVQLLSLRIHLKANSRLTTNYIITLPPSAISGPGGSTNNDTVFIPVQSIRQDSDPLTAVGNTIAMNLAGNYASFQFGALPALTTGLLIAMQF